MRRSGLFRVRVRRPAVNRVDRGPSRGEATLAQQMTVAGLPPFEREFRFAPPRRWRFDFAWPALKLAVEVEGGTWTGGRHTRGLGYERDLEKYNACAMAGWKLLRYTTRQVMDGTALAEVTAAIQTCYNGGSRTVLATPAGCLSDQRPYGR